VIHLAIESATRRLIVTAGDPTDPARTAAAVRDITPGRGTPVLVCIDEVLRGLGATIADVAAIGVGVGPGSFTGLRAGLATAKVIAWRGGIPLVALPTDATLRRAARHSPMDPGTDDLAILLPAGARDHYLALPGTEPMLVPPGADLVALVAGRPVVAVDVDPATPAVAALDAAPPATELGRAALEHLAPALLEVLAEHLSAGDLADPATLVPRYVAMPRGITTDTARDTEAIRVEGTWSPTHP
jgi:tRNA threonylcarbamoyl adenosine modification protein YeaZ